MMKRKASMMLYALGSIFLLASCGTAQREATEAAVSAAQTAINAAQGAAQQFVPDHTRAAQDALQAAKDALAKADYALALKNAQDAAQKAKEAVSAAAVKKEEWTKNWDSWRASAPKTMSAVQAKLDAYKKSGKLPAGVDKAQMDDAKAQFDQLKQGWSDATAAYKQGNLADAIKKVSSLKDGLQKLKELLGLQS